MKARHIQTNEEGEVILEITPDPKFPEPTNPLMPKSADHFANFLAAKGITIESLFEEIQRARFDNLSDVVEIRINLKMLCFGIPIEVVR